MAGLPAPQCPTLSLADRVLEETENARRGPPWSLGIGTIGEECERRLWYSFRWVAPEHRDASAHRGFAEGHLTEKLVFDRLRLVPGLVVHTIDEETGKQFKVSDFEGHIQGRLDGAVLGLVQAPKTWHVAEVKSSKKMGDLAKAVAKVGEKNALREWNFTYYAQAVLYMHYTGMDRHYLVCATPGGRDWIAVRTEADPVEAARLRAKAERVIFAEHPPERISEKPDFYKCRWCSFSGICHEAMRTPVEANCRTCLHVTPLAEGGWHCARWDKALTVDEQRVGCPAHLYIPALVPGEQVDASETGEWVDYRMPDGSTWRDGAAP